MFSSLASFLPASLHINVAPFSSNNDDSAPPQELPQSSFDPTTDDEDEVDSRVVDQLQRQETQQQQQQPASRKEKEPKTANETFIFVRPPPSKSNHPLNLQVQLVPPNARPPTGVASVEASTPTSASSAGTDGGTPLTRTSSNRSSNYTNYTTSSTASFSSVASSNSGGTTGTRRTIIPLYNLQAHNVLTNVIVDAGTDAKIAKFQKRGLELMDLAILEPVEVWGERHREKEARREGMRISVDESGTIVSVTPLSPGMTNSNRTSLVSARSLTGFLQSNRNASNTVGSNSRPATPSASSSAASLHSSNQNHNSQGHVQALHPQFVVSPPASDDPTDLRQQQYRWREQMRPSLDSESSTPVPSSATPTPVSVSLQSSSKRANLFSKLKFNKRNSTLNPLTTTKEVPHSNDTTTSLQGGTASSSGESLSGLASFAMAPLIPGDLGHRIVHIGDSTTVSSTSAVTNKKQYPADISMLSPPTSPASQHTPTQGHPSTPTQLMQKEREEASPVSPTPTVAPSRTGVFGGAVGHNRNSSLTNAISSSLKGGKNRLSAVLGDKRGAPLSSVVPSSPLSTRNDNDMQRQQQASMGKPTGVGNGSASGSISSNRDENRKDARRSVDSFNSLNNGNNKNLPFKQGGLLHHSNSQQFIGVGSPQQPQQQQQQQSNLSDTPVPGMPVTLRQLQLRPPVLGIQPTFVSASSSYSNQSHPDPSSVSLGSSGGHGNSNEDHAGVNQREVDGRSMTVEGRERVRKASSSGSLPQMNAKGKEKALMYVWLVRKWLKRRGNGHEQGGSGLWNGFVGEGGGGLFGSGGAFGAGKQQGSFSSGTGVSLYQSQSNTSQFGSFQGSVVGGGFEVRFEWKRARAKGSRRGRKGARESKKRRSISASVARTEEGTEKDEAREGKNGERSGRKGREREASSVSQVPAQQGQNQNQLEDTARVSGSVNQTIVDGSPQKMTIAEKRRANRLSIASFSSITEGDARTGSPARGSPSRTGTMGSTSSGKKRLSLNLKKGTGGDNEDDGDQGDGGEDDEDSDSEDSDTPWVCTMKIRRMAPLNSMHMQPQSAGLTTVVGGTNGYAGRDGRGDKENMLRVKVGTLSPTPHHPKVVAMLKVPYPLPDIEVERMGIVKRKGASPTSAESQGQGQAWTGPPYTGLTMTAEEIKDIVCSTGLWLVVREGVGGVGKISRKGDGWKIRG